MQSLVEAVLRQREPEWRARDLELEKLGKLNKRPASSRGAPGKPRVAMAIRDRAAALSNQGWAAWRIAIELGVSEKAVRNALLLERDRGSSSKPTSAESQSVGRAVPRGDVDSAVGNRPIWTGSGNPRRIAREKVAALGAARSVGASR